MKKKVLTTLSIVLILGLAAMGILAYLTSTDSDVNVMTLGNVAIDQIEQQENAETGELEPFEQEKELYPGTSVSKIVTVENTGKSDCYFRTLIAFEDVSGSETFGIEFPISENGYRWSWGAPEAIIEIDGVTYQVYEALYTKPLVAGETSPASLTKVDLAVTSTNEDMEALGGTYDILVLSQAVQIEGFADADAALIAGFGEVNVENCIKWFTGVIEDNKLPEGTKVSTFEELEAAFDEGGAIVLMDDIEVEKSLKVKTGVDVNLFMNGKTLIAKDSAADPVFDTYNDSTLIIDGDGEVYMDNPFTSLMIPRGDVVIENGTFVRNVPEGTPVKQVGAFFVGISNSSSSVVINGGYFDGGYYDPNADISKFEETADDVAKRGKSGDKNTTRVALKNNIQLLLNKSSNAFKIYGGTFVGANPAWGDEGCMLPTTPNYLRPWSYYQGALLDGQTFNENGIVLPEGYTITKGATEKGIPTYTVTYNK